MSFGEVPGERTPLAVPILLSAAGMVSGVGATFLAGQVRAGVPIASPAPGAPPAPRAPRPPAAEPSVAPPRPTRRSPEPPCRPNLVVLFGPSQVVPPPIADRLAPLVRFALREPDGTVIVEGHSDNFGSGRTNLRISWRRAREVSAQVERAGFPLDRIRTRAFGEYQPTLFGEISDRRVEIRASGRGPLCPPEVLR